MRQTRNLGGWRASLRVAAAAFLMQAVPVAQAQVQQNWPSFPLLEITTEGGEDPSGTIVNPPDGAVGVSIVSQYMSGRLVMTLSGDTIYDSGHYVKDSSGVRIKIRGNSTRALLDQHPYKLKLSKKFD